MEDELYLENIDEFVTDQNRVVTYKWLSYTLGVHVNQAKQMLYEYVERKRKENSGAQLHVTYLVAGNLIQNGHIGHKVAVVKEDELDAMKLKLSTVASVHVYSVQKAMLKDSSPLYSTDYDIIKANLQKCSQFSAIHCAAAVARTAAEMPQAEPPAQVDSQLTRSTSAAAAPVTNGHAPSTSSKHTSQQASGIMGMFAAKSATKSQDKHKEAKVEAKEAPSAPATSSKGPAKGNVLNNFFGKAALSTGKGRSESQQQREEKVAASSVEPRMSSDAPDLERPRKKAELSKVHQKEKKRAKRAERSDSEEKEAETLKKKRRRIKQPESDSSNSEEVPESPLAPEVKDVSPEPEPALKPSADPVRRETSSGEKKRKRKRVLKSRTFVDEEGCIVTEKVYESESCTDSEEEFRSKPPPAHKPPVSHHPSLGAAKKDSKEEKKASKRGAAAPRANRQASIMGFFQKK
uniref:DNA polymerase delta subunit 3 n=1 Tax=Pogona vitticeps TaxID=103695 RepID=A0ABM5FVS1_9SAUR